MSSTHKTIILKLKVETLEPFHIGDGMNLPGLYDSGQVCDSEGYPMVPDDTVRGLVRDAASRLKNRLADFGIGSQETSFKWYSSEEGVDRVFNEIFDFLSGDGMLLTSWR
ncbi:MAG TPA: RAMP superfamily CRISPR-associated protein, partial [bacterium]|nr:RAMP superfamily CRISPR-associated protein [bacterium]